MYREPNSYSEKTTNSNRLLVYQKADACCAWSTSRWMQVNMLMIPQTVYVANDISDAATFNCDCTNSSIHFVVFMLHYSYVTHKALYVLSPPCTCSNVIAANGLTEVPT